MRVTLLFVLCLHLSNVTAVLQALHSGCAEEDVCSDAHGCPGDEPGSEDPCSENCGGCVRCPVASDLPAPVVELSVFELPQRSAASLESLQLSRWQARNVFRPPRERSSFGV